MEDFLKFDEKRKSPRFSVSVPLEYKRLKDSPESKKGSLAKDLSAGGVRFVTNEFISFTARMLVDIALPVPQRPITALSKVAWIRKLPRGDSYEIGNQFLEISKEDKNRLSDYLNRISAPKENL